MCKNVLLIVALIGPVVVAAAEPGVPLDDLRLFDSSIGFRATLSSFEHRCASDGDRVWCWGDNNHGQLGIGGRAGVDLATPVASLPAGVDAIAVGGLHSCAVTDGRLFCWGDNAFGQLGTGDLQNRPLPVEVLPGVAFNQVEAGARHTCAVTVDDRVLCWGSNASGQSGDSMNVASVIEPIEVMQRIDVALALGGSHSCALSGGVVECWGANLQGQLGDGAVQSRSDPVPVAALPDGIERIAAARSHNCASDGETIWCWGENIDSQTGRLFDPDDDATRLTPLPNPVAGIEGPVADLAVATDQSCAAVEEAMLCWGRVEDWPADPSDRAVERWRASAEIMAAADPDCALVEEQAVCINGTGRGDVRSAFRAARVDGLRPLSLDTMQRARLIVGPANGCAQYGQRELRCWGANGFGQLGQGHSDPVAGAVDLVLPGDPIVHDLTFGVAHACAVTDAGLFCWGNNFFNQLGLSEPEDRLEPTAIPVDIDQTTGVVAGFEFTCLWSPGMTTMRCFGEFPASIDGSAPPEQPREVDWGPGGLLDLSAGREHACALLETSSEPVVRCWGRIKTEPDNDGPRTVRDVVTGLAGVERLSGRGFSHCAHSSSGVACWGLDHTRQALPRGPNRPPFRVELPLGAAFEGRAEGFSVGGRHACVAGRTGETRCIGLPLVQACSFAEAIGDIGGGSGVGGCLETEFTELSDDDLGWLPIGGLPSIEADAIESGDQFSCARVGRWIRCWGRGAGRGLVEPEVSGSPAPVLEAAVLEPAATVAVEFEQAGRCPAFLLSRVSLLEPDADRTAGAWGAEVFLREGRTRLHGGLNFGGYAHAQEAVPGFAAFRIDNDQDAVQRVNLELQGAGDRFEVEVFSSVPGSGLRDRVYSESLLLSEQPSIRTLALGEGFHIIRLTPAEDVSDPALFVVSAQTEALDGGPASFRYGAVVGGYLDSGLLGYTALCTDDARELEVRTQARNERGPVGAGDLRLEIENRSTGEVLFDTLNQPLSDRPTVRE